MKIPVPCYTFQYGQKKKQRKQKNRQERKKRLFVVWEVCEMFGGAVWCLGFERVVCCTKTLQGKFKVSTVLSCKAQSSLTCFIRTKININYFYTLFRYGGPASQKVFIISIYNQSKVTVQLQCFLALRILLVYMVCSLIAGLYGILVFHVHAIGIRD